MYLGDIINLTTSEPIYEFSQKDLLTRNVVFRHRGAAYAGKTLGNIVVAYYMFQNP